MVSLTLGLAFFQSGTIPLRPSMLIDETGMTDVSGLVDGKTDRPFFPGWNRDVYPAGVVIDLGSECRVDRVRFNNESGEAAAEVGTGRPFAWKPSGLKLAGHRSWVEAPVGATTRWLRLVLKSPHSVGEIEVIGARSKPLPLVVPSRRKLALPTMDRLVGVNAFIDDPIDVIAGPGGSVREYHSFPWDVEGADRKVRFQPSGAAGGNAWSFDDYYRKLKDAGCSVAPCVQQAPAWMFGAKSNEDKPIPKDANSEDPRSYALHAKHLFQYAARYGSQKVADARLDLASGQPRRSGLGLLQWLENWNEPDRTWQGREARFTPYELAAMTSADYDGHRGQIADAGVKTADPKMKLAIGGLIGIKTDYIRAMKLWSDVHRGVGNFPADALNVHYYCSTVGDQGFKPDTKALTPEEDRLREKLTVLTDWRDANLPDREVWLSEFGYDVNPGSPLFAPVIGAMTSEMVQAAWLARSYFAIAAARVDRAPMFMLRDVDPKDKIQFSSSGLVGPKGSWAKKPAWHVLTNLRRSLRGMRFAGDVATGDPRVKAMRFSDGKRSAYAVWCPTREDRRVGGFRLKAKVARRVDLVTGQTTASASTFEVKEMPTLVFERD